ncbi:MAG: hypothetical protein NXY57DRAFT_1083991 [Lentinula lateritia]|nr:MAG: hypothetical protein NXY57DRAFT_1083991 [Lentinula lateritia]
MSRPRRSQLCRFLDTREGCRRGADCTFSHDRSNVTPQGNTPSRAPSSPLPSSPSNTGRNSAPPRNVCNFYWTTGQCNRGFDCVFRHVQQKHNNGGEAPDTTGIPPEVRDELDFSTVEGLADINNIIPDPQYRCSPSQAHNDIKGFIADRYQFPSQDAPSTMIKFARILGSVDRRNGLWVRLLNHIETSTLRNYDPEFGSRPGIHISIAFFTTSNMADPPHPRLSYRWS